MWKLWQVLILTASLAMWVGWIVWSHFNKDRQNKDKQNKDESYDADLFCMINAINFILILLIFD